MDQRAGGAPVYDAHTVEHAYDEPVYDDASYDDTPYQGAHYDSAHVDENAYTYDQVDHPADLLIGPADVLHEHEEDSHRRRRSPLVRWGAIVAALAVVVVGGYFALQVISGLLPSFGGGGDDVADYPGPGGSEVSIEVPEGAGGGQIAEILAENDVVASASAFAAAAAVDPRSVSIQPGSYRMLEQMSAEQALERMLDSEFRDVNGVTVREGLWKEEVFAILAEQTGNDVSDYEDVDPADLDLPDAANGEIEGYLFPDTYAFGPGDTPQDQLSEMVALGKTKYADLGLDDADLAEAIIKGSLIQAEGAFSDDLPKVARVIENRLEEDQPLGFDSTVHFIFQERGRAGTTDEQRDSDSPYNTYKVVGLPPGPINSPGTAAIEAAMNPAEGPWLYFVTTNPSTGETKFAVTFEEHNDNVAEFQQWCADNPDDC
ncbi:MAG: endolytic transglycosylase MltG [Ornithinimicrobium sp.]